MIVATFKPLVDRVLTSVPSSNNVVNDTVIVCPAGDMNGDGKEDLLWLSAAGTVAASLLNGGAISGVMTMAPDRGPDPNWRFVGIGDFDADGKPDFVWRNQATGVDEIWLMDGAARKAVA